MKKNILTGILLSSVIICNIPAFAAEAEPALTLPAQKDTAIFIDAPVIKKITVNGETVNLYDNNISQNIFEQNGNIMIPLRAVAEKMGFNVGWNSEKQSVTIGDDSWEVILCIGSDSYIGTSKVSIGTTAPQNYGAAPQIIQGTTYVPAKMFELLDCTYNINGEFLNFSKSDTIIDKTGQEYSNDTLIISVDENTSQLAINEFFKANNLEIIYQSDNFNIYTVKLQSPMTSDELDKYISELEKNENILAVNKNYILHLDDNVEIPNPFVPYENMADVKKVLSFTPAVPSSLPKGYEIDEITSTDSNFLQIIYTNNNNDSIYYRTAKGNGDISGDWNKYTINKEVQIGNLTVTMRGNDKISNAIWQNGEFTFSVFSNVGLEEKELIELIENIK